MIRHRLLFGALWVCLVVAMLWPAGLVVAGGPEEASSPLVYRDKITQEDKEAAAQTFKEQRDAAIAAGVMEPAVMDPGGVPHYFGPYANWAYSPLPKGPVAAITVEAGGSGYVDTIISITDLYGAGSGATATATVTGGVVTDIALTGGGVDYVAPIVTITDTAGTGASASASIGGPLSGGIRKFINSLPGLGPTGANDLGQYLPVAVADTTTYPGSDYYEIAVVEYEEKMHTDLPPTRHRGYVQLETGVVPGTVPLTNPDGSSIMMPDGVTQAVGVDEPHFLGPAIVSTRDVPVRIKFYNLLPTGTGGDLFLPVDTTVMGSGMGPIDMPGMPGMKESYTENRATLHLHGNNSVWISDGTPHQWITPAGEMTSYPKGVSVVDVPDMPAPGDGAMTFFYTNSHSARLMFYHDHSYGITRLNVYAGEAAAYLVTDEVEQDLINGTNDSGVNPGNLQVLPDIGVPLVIQDRTFVDANTIAATDPTWNWGTTPPVPHTGDLWYPHVYMTAQNPYDPSGANPFGRWHYAAWFWPPATNLAHPPVPNPYYGTNPWEPPMNPGMPDNSSPGEAFMDTFIVNGTVYPYLEVDPRTYRFRILNAGDDRFLNLQWYTADPTVTTLDGRTNTEVKMVTASDGREGGIPDPATAGPDWIQIGTEGGFLPKPVVLPSQPVTYIGDPTLFNVGNVDQTSLLVGTAERADVLVDFSQFAGQTLILYNDAPTAFPANIPQYDYYTGNPDRMDIGSTPTTQAGYGPNIRTVMQVRVAASAPAPAYDLAALEAVFAKTGSKPGVFEVSQDPIIIPSAEYDTAYNASFPEDQFVRQDQTSHTFQNVWGSSTTIPIQPKALQDEMGEVFDDYGRMMVMLGLELPFTAAGAQNFAMYGYTSPPVEIIKGVYASQIGALEDGTQIWRITHNGVDTHTIHTHLYNAQLINRVAWDGFVYPPHPNELGWKETFMVSPLEHTIIALRAVVPDNLPFDVPNSVRLIDVTMPDGMMLPWPGPNGFFDPTGDPVVAYGAEGDIMNHSINYGWEYVYHCHILAHEEMDMMHGVVVAVPPKTPSNLSAADGGATVTLNWTDNSLGETGFTVQRADTPDFGTGLISWTVGADVTTYNDDTALSQTYYYRVFATNTVGDTMTPNFPTMTAESAFSNTAQYPAAGEAGPLHHIVVTPASASVAVGGTQAFTALGYDEFNVLRGGDTFTWSVSNAAAGSINAGTGMFTAGNTAATYNGVVRATSGGIVGTASVTVTPGPLHHVGVTPGIASVGVGGGLTFTAQGYDQFNNLRTGDTFTWSVTNPTAGSINASTGAFTAGSVPGSYANVVRATSGGIFGSATVNVTQGLDHIVVSPANPAVVMGGAQTFTAQGYDVSNNLRSGDVFAWSVTDPQAGTIHPVTGLFTAGTLAGSFPNVIQATSGAIVGTASVTVIDVPLALLPGATTTNVGSTFTVAINTNVPAGTQVSGVDAFVDFDPAYLEVVDADGATPGVQVAPGALLPIVLANTVNNATGQISFSSGTLSPTPPTGGFLVATVTFQGKAATPPGVTTPILVSMVSPRQSVVSNAGVAIMGAHADATAEVLAGALLNAQVTLPGGSRPPAGRVVPITMKLFTPGANVLTAVPLATFAATTVDTGSNNVTFQAPGVPAGNYDIVVVTAGTLANVKLNVAVAGGTVVVNFGTLLAGNANDDNQISALDFSILAASFLKSTGQAGFDARADFDKTGQVNSLDFSMLAANYLRSAPVVVP